MKKILLLGAILGISSQLMASSVATSDTTPTTCKTTCKTTCQVSKNDIKQNINIGFVNTSGNTKTTNLNGKYDLLATMKGYEDKKLEVIFDLTAFFSENNGIKDNEEYRTNLSANQFINDKLFVYTSLSWFQNKFLNYDSNLNLGAGIGKELINNEKCNLKAKVGIAHNVQEFTVAVDGRDKHVFTSFTQFLEYNKNLNESSKFYAKLGLNENFADITGDYDLFSVLGVNFKVDEDISVILEQEVRYDSVPAGDEKTDTKTLAKIGYSF